MSQTQRTSQILKWFDKEKTKDSIEIKLSKDKLIREIKGLNKEDLFKKEEPVKKITLWQRIRKIIWGS
jgi:hypothetical protein